MSVFVIQNKIEDKAENSVVDDEKDLNSTVNKTVENINQPESSVINNNLNKKIIVCDGPLSSIYTNALNAIYAKPENDNISQESQANDHFILAKNTIDAAEEEIAEPEIYLYATNTDEIEKNSLADTYHGLRVALGNKAKKTVVAIEVINGGYVYTNHAKVENTLHASGITVIHQRNSVINKIKSYLGQS